MAFDEGGAVVTIESSFHTPPARLTIAVPSFVELTDVETDSGQKDVREGLIYLTPDVKRVALKWRDRKGAHAGTYQDLLKLYRGEYGYMADAERYRTEEPPKPSLTTDEETHAAVPLSFDVVRGAFAYEYARRFAEHVEGGGAVLGVEAPALLTAEQRERRYGEVFGNLEPLKGKATASASLPRYPPSGAIDGSASNLQSSWQTDPYPAWLRIDLDDTRELRAVRVHPYWGGGRYYHYTVEISADGQSWQMVGDMRDNRTPSTPDGDRFEFEPTEVSCIRVNMLYHNLNRGVHIVEVTVED